MITILLVFLPTLIVMGLMIQFHIRKRRWVPLVVSPFVACACIFHCFVLWMEWNEVAIAPAVLSARDIVSSLIFPAIYVLLCSKSGVKWFSLSTLSMCLLALLNFCGTMTFCLDGHEVGDFTVDHMVHLFARGKLLVTIRVVEFIVLIQLLWILTWAYELYKRMKKEDLHFSKRSKRLAWMFYSAFSVVFVSILVPNSVWEAHPDYLYFFFVPISILVTMVELAISWGWMLTPVLDNNNEPAMNTIRVDDEMLKLRIRELVENEKLYLRSDLKVADVATLLGTNRNYVSLAISSMGDENFNAYLNRHRISYAKRLIIDNPTISLESVATRSGFSSASSFTKVFKKIEGVNPSQIKRSVH